MKKCSFIISIITFSLFQFACSSEKKPELNEREKLHQEVMEIHDAVMPKMSDINRVKRKLADLMATDSMLTEEAKIALTNGIAALITAETSMTGWMRAFEAPKPSVPDKKAIEYLNNEKEKISSVSDQMLNSLKKGEELLSQLEKGQETNSK